MFCSNQATQQGQQKYWWNIILLSIKNTGRVEKIYRVSQKKGCSKFEGHFRPLNGRKSKKVTPKTPPKIQFYLLGGVFSPVYDMYTLLYIMYTMLVSGIC